MEEILHQLIGNLSHYLQGFIHPRWCRISSINSIKPKPFLLRTSSKGAPREVFCRGQGQSRRDNTLNGGILGVRFRVFQTGKNPWRFCCRMKKVIRSWRNIWKSFIYVYLVGGLNPLKNMSPFSSNRDEHSKKSLKPPTSISLQFYIFFK